jgi:hypothetical protein
MTLDNALARFDSLPPIDTGFMLGRWKGSEVPTGHPLDGLLALSGWYGKAFVSEEDVHPLLFHGRGDRVFAVNPGRVPLGLVGTVRPPSFLHSIVPLLRPVIGTRRSRARLRMVTYRGVTSAAMCYDQLPIIDSFRKLDESRVLGAMDQKGSPTPYLFMLERDDTPLKVSV